MEVTQKNKSNEDVIGRYFVIYAFFLWKERIFAHIKKFY